MKHLPNLLTLTNLFFGCIAIVFILDAQPFQVLINGEYYYVTGTERAYWGAVFIGLAAVCDLLDGFTARTLQIYSPIGKDLDSLADLVSFGVAPSMILFKMLWAAWMLEEDAFDISMLSMAPAFLITCFAALRLARFNVTPAKGSGFTGMPVPAVGLLVASFPLINFYNPYGIGMWLQGKWTIYLIVAVLCWLMVSQIRFFKFMPPKWSMSYLWPRLILVIAGVATLPFLGSAAVPLVFILYVLLSLIYRDPEPISSGENAMA